MHPLASIREKLINHILEMKETDKELAKWSLRNYHEMMPWLELIKGVKERLNEICQKG